MPFVSKQIYSKEACKRYDVRKLRREARILGYKLENMKGLRPSGYTLPSVVACATYRGLPVSLLATFEFYSGTDTVLRIRRSGTPFAKDIIQLAFRDGRVNVVHDRTLMWLLELKV